MDFRYPPLSTAATVSEHVVTAKEAVIEYETARDREGVMQDCQVMKDHLVRFHPVK